jgi:hypothetical protein
MGGYKEATCSCIKKALRVDSLPIPFLFIRLSSKKMWELMMLPGISLPQV